MFALNARKAVLMSMLLASVSPMASFAKSTELEGPGGTGGGDSLLCNFGDGEKYYAYDYLASLAKDSSKLNPEFLAATDEKEILNSIATRLEGKLPAMAASLRDFVKSFKNTDLFSKEKRVWTKGPNPLVDVPDESRLRQIPKECFSNGVAQLFQTVVRKETPRIEYNEDTSLTEGLKANAAIQLSFLYVHEWLRDYTSDPDLIMKLNRILHETSWLEASGEDARYIFVQAGASAMAKLETPNEVKARKVVEKQKKDRENALSKLNSDLLKVYEKCRKKEISLDDAIKQAGRLVDNISALSQDERSRRKLNLTSAIINNRCLF